MKVTFDKLIAQNFRQIADREFNFRDGLNLIVGANGLGKTNLLHAITWCLFRQGHGRQNKIRGCSTQSR